MRALVVGANHRTAPLSLRDTLFVDDLAQPDFLNDLNLPQAVAVSTCDRVEVWTVCEDPAAIEPHVVETMARRGGLPADSIREQIYSLTDQDAVRHCFA